MSETTPRRVATRQRLVEAAIREFANRGIDATSVEHVSEAAGFTRGAFYSNFATKDDLCVAVLEHHRDVVMAGLAEAFADPSEALSLEWATGTALTNFFTVIAPTEEFRITLMEIRLRAVRVPELAARSEALADEVRPQLVDFMTRIASGLGLRFRLPTDNLIDLFEALYFQGSATSQGLIGPVAIALSEPAGETDD